MSRPTLRISESIALLLGAMGLMFAVLAMSTALVAARHELSWQQASGVASGDPMTLGLAQLVGLMVFVVIGAARAHREGPMRDALHVLPTPWRAVALAALAGVCLQFPLAELSAVAADLVPAIAPTDETQRALEAVTRIDGPLRAFSVPFAFVVVAPLTEELLFRGLLLGALQTRMGGAGALMLTSLLFGIFHVAPLAMIYASVAGVALGWVFLRTGSVLPGLAMHAACNAIGVLLPADLLPIPGLNTDADHLPLSLVLAASAGLLLALALIPAAPPAPEEPDTSESPEDP